MRTSVISVMLFALSATIPAQAQQHQRRGLPFITDTPMVHDPVMAYEDSTYHIFATGMGIQHMTSVDRKNWTVHTEPVMSVIPKWTHDSVPGFTHHVWAPDIIQWHGRVIDDKDQPWIVWGSFWDGIQLARLDTTMHIAKGCKPQTIARRFNLDSKASKNALPINPNPPKNPTSDFAGPNAIEAPFIFKHNGYYYLFVSWDYCCQGSKSNYRVAVGRSKNVEGPYLDSKGIDMRYGGGDLFIEGDKKSFEAAGHCAAYHIDNQDIFICHGYSIAHKGASILIQRPISWTADGWPKLAN